MRATHVCILFAFLVLVGVEASLAQSPDSIYTIGEITVTATRDRTVPGRAPQRVSVITEAAVRSTGAQNLADLLEKRSGLFIRRYGQGLATVSLRGAGPSQTALMIDGLRLSDPQLGQFDLSLLPTYLIESVEVVHGPTSALYGSDGLAGAINLRRRRPDADHVTLLTEVGAFGERRMSGGAALDGPRWSGSIAAEYSYADGDFPYLNEALFPARVVRRRNADREKRSVFGMASVDAGVHRARAALLYAEANRGLPGGSGSPPVGERQWDEHVRLWLEDDVRLDRSLLKLTAFVHRSSLRYANPQIAVDETGRVTSGGTEAVLRHPVRENTVLVGGMSGGYATADHPSLAASAGEYHGAAFVSASHSISGVLVYPAMRTDLYMPSSGGARAAVSPRIGVNLPLTGGLYAKANAGTAFRMPTFNDRFWQPGGNPTLRPERSRSLEGGLSLNQSSVAAELTVFGSRTNDQIVWTYDSEDVWTPENLSRTAVYGVETTARWRAHDRLSAGVIYTYTRAVDHSDPSSRTYGRQLRYVPRNQAKLYADTQVGPLRASVHGRYVGRRFVTSDESESLDPVFTLDGQAGVVHPVGPFRARLSLVIENVLNAQYALIQHYPMPPRHARVRLLIETR